MLLSMLPVQHAAILAALLAASSVSAAPMGVLETTPLLHTDHVSSAYVPLSHSTPTPPLSQHDYASYTQLKIPAPQRASKKSTAGMSTPLLEKSFSSLDGTSSKPYPLRKSTSISTALAKDWSRSGINRGFLTRKLSTSGTVAASPFVKGSKLVQTQSQKILNYVTAKASAINEKRKMNAYFDKVQRRISKRDMTGNPQVEEEQTLTKRSPLVMHSPPSMSHIKTQTRKLLRSQSLPARLTHTLERSASNVGASITKNAKLVRVNSMKMIKMVKEKHHKQMSRARSDEAIYRSRHSPHSTESYYNGIRQDPTYV